MRITLFLSSLNQTTIYYGIDVTKDTLHISYQSGLDDKGQPQWHYQTLANQLDDPEQCCAQLPTNAQLIFEYTATYSARLAWVSALRNRPFGSLTPNQSKGFAPTLKAISNTIAATPPCSPATASFLSRPFPNSPTRLCINCVNSTNTSTICVSAGKR